jgi:hypothetical protein
LGPVVSVEDVPRQCEIEKTNKEKKESAMKKMLVVLVCVFSLVLIGSGCTSCSERTNGTEGAAVGGFAGWFAGPLGSAAGAAIGSNLGSRVGVENPEAIDRANWVGYSPEGLPLVQDREGKVHVVKNKQVAPQNGSANGGFGSTPTYYQSQQPPTQPPPMVQPVYGQQLFQPPTYQQPVPMMPPQQQGFNPMPGQTININVYGGGNQQGQTSVKPATEAGESFAQGLPEGIPSVKNSSNFSISIHAKYRGQKVAGVDLAPQETKAVSWWPVNQGAMQYEVIFSDPSNGGMIGKATKSFQPYTGMTWNVQGYTQGGRLLDNIR